MVKVSTLSTLNSAKALPHNKKHGVDGLKSIDTGIDTMNPIIDTSANELLQNPGDKYTGIGVDTGDSVDTSIDKKIVIDTDKTTDDHDIQPISVDSVDRKLTFSKVLNEQNCIPRPDREQRPLKVGDICMYVGKNHQLAKQYVGILIVKQIDATGNIAALTSDSRMTTWIAAELKLAQQIDPID